MRQLFVVTRPDWLVDRNHHKVCYACPRCFDKHKMFVAMDKVSNGKAFCNACSKYVDYNKYEIGFEALYLL